MIHHPTHWIAVALAVALGLIAIEAYGQMSSGAAAMFEGRPSMAGAQAGLGAQAGPPQGGLGVQGNEAAERNLRPPRVIREIREARANERERDVEEDAVVAANNIDMLLLPSGRRLVQ